MSKTILPKELLVRCIALHDQGQWIGICLNFNLAAQADTFEEAKALLDAQIRSYLTDAIAGDDRQHAEYLLTRKAPMKYWLMYWKARVFHVLNFNGNTTDYKSSLPLALA